MFASRWHRHGSLSSFLRRSRCSNRRGITPPACQPRLESLEHRSLPSILTVTSTADSGPGSLRAALTAAASGDTISFALPNPSTIHLTSGTLNVTVPVNIVGPGPSELTIQGNNTFGDFSVSASGNTTISGLTITGGRSAGSGGGIDTGNAALLTLTNDVISENHAATQGGGIQVSAALTMTNCTVVGNVAVVAGGGINSNFNTVTTITGSTLDSNVVSGQNVTGGGGGAIWNDGSLTLINSTIDSNTVNGAAGNNANGGGLFSAGDGSYTIIGCAIFENAAQGGQVTTGTGGAGLGGAARLATSGIIANCTFNKNSAVGGRSSSGTGGNGVGGGIEWIPSASPTLFNCTIVGNQAIQGPGTILGASGFGGGIDTDDSGTVENSIIAGNIAVLGPDIDGKLTTALADLVGNGNGSDVPVGGNLLNQVGSPASPIDPLLGPMQNNGGPTQSMMPLATSTAIDRGNNAFVQSAVDQRGDLRVVDGTVDIGAIEIQQFRRIAVGPGAGMAPEVKEYDPVNGKLKLDFMAYESSFLGAYALPSRT